MTKPFDITKPYQCKNGGEAGATLAPNGNLYGWYRQERGQYSTCWWSADGRAYSGAIPDMQQYDLVNVPERKTVTVWLVWKYDWYRETGQTDKVLVNAYPVRQNISMLDNIIAQKAVEVTYEVGEGLDQ